VDTFDQAVALQLCDVAPDRDRCDAKAVGEIDAADYALLFEELDDARVPLDRQRVMCRVGCHVASLTVRVMFFMSRV